MKMTSQIAINVLTFALSLVLRQYPPARAWWEKFPHKRAFWIVGPFLVQAGWSVLSCLGWLPGVACEPFDLRAAFVTIAVGQIAYGAQKAAPTPALRMAYAKDKFDRAPLAQKIQVTLGIATFVLVAALAVMLYSSRPVVQFSPLEVPSSPLPTPAATPAALKNPGFEQPYNADPTKGNIMTAHDWRAWWQTRPPCRPPCQPQYPSSYLPCPDNCQKKAQTFTDGYLSLTFDGGAITVTNIASDPVGVAEVVLFMNPAILNAREKTVIAPCGELLDRVAYIRYQNEVTQTETITGDLFRLDVSVFDETTTTLELFYFLGAPNGGAVPSAGRKLTATINTAPSGGKCKPDNGCFWCEPEMGRTDDQFRCQSGDCAKTFVYGRQGDYAQYQIVSGATPGDYYKFCVNLMAWQMSKWGTPPYSDAPYDMGLRVGIDPYGGEDPFATSMVWSAPGNSFDHHTEFCVIARVWGDFSVWWWASPRFDWARLNNDVYADDASLTRLGAGQAPMYQMLMPAVFGGR